MEGEVRPMENQIILIDAYSQIFRSFYAIRHLSNSRGEPTNAVFVFTRLLLKIQQEYPTGAGAMFFDCGKVGFRLKLAPEYKANRPPMPDALKQQLPIIREMAAAFGWPLLEEPEYEADDLIAAFAQALEPRQIRIISSDKDLAQLVDDRIHLLAPDPKNTGFEERGVAEIEAKFAVSPALIPDYLALLGDSSDNIPGVPGIGAKGAAQLLREFGPASEWLDHPEKLAGSKFAAKLTGDASEILRRNLALIKLRSDLPERFAADTRAALRRGSPQWSKIGELCRKCELKSILRELPPEARERSETTVQPEPEEDDLFTFAAKNSPDSRETTVEQGELF